MRRRYPFVVLLSGSLISAACSKKADTIPGGVESASSPVTIEATAPEPTAAEEDSGITFSLSGGSNPSAGQGATGGAPAATSATETNSAPAQQLNRIHPFYPLSLRMRGIEGRVDVQVNIDAEGRVTKAEVVRATEERFVPYALEAARAARFLPAVDNGKPVPTAGVLHVPFASELGSAGLPPDSILARIAYIDGLYYMKDDTGKTVPANFPEPLRLSILTPYPASAKPGEVLSARVTVSISEEGQVTNVTVSDASNPQFASALEEVAKFWQFIPQLKDGKPVPRKAAFPIKVTVPK